VLLNINLSKDFSLKFGAHKIKVKFVADDHSAINSSTKTKNNKDSQTSEVSQEEEAPSPPDHGAYHSHSLTIYIKKSDPDSIKLSCLLHEIIHAAEHIYTIDMEHTHVNLIGEVMAQVLQDNFASNRKKNEEKYSKVRIRNKK
jgi:hypothetical protein